MLVLDAIARNPAGVTLLEVAGAAMVLMLAVFVAGTWAIVALGHARRQAREFAVTPDEAAIETLRREQLVADGTPGADETVRARLETIPADEARRSA